MNNKSKDLFYINVACAMKRKTLENCEGCLLSAYYLLRSYILRRRGLFLSAQSHRLCQ